MGLALKKLPTTEVVCVRPQRPLQLVAYPQLSIVIVNYHRWEHTASLVRQLLKSEVMKDRDAEIRIIDNHSPRHRVAKRLRKCQGVSLQRWGRNRGFACAVNEGYRQSRGAWILLLNPDMSIPAGFLDQVFEYIQYVEKREPMTGIVGFGLRNTDGSRQLSAGKYPTFFGSLARLLLPRPRRKYQRTSETHPEPVDWVTGCCMLVRRECLDQLGGLDQDFFLYYEDVDLCRRAKETGWSVSYMPQIEAVHHRPLHLRRVSPALRAVTRHSLLTYARKHWPRWQFRLLSRIVRLESWLRGRTSKWKGQGSNSERFAELIRLAGHLAKNQSSEARKCLKKLTDVACFYDDANTPFTPPIDV